MAQLELFGEKPELAPQAARLAPRLRRLAEEGVYFGTSSWKYPGWLGTIYTPSLYETRGKLSQKKFEAECLREYGAVFPTVGGDFSFYQFPTAEYWARLFGEAPATLLFGLKVPESITVLSWPKHARYGRVAGQENPDFLNAALFRRAFLKPLEPYAERVGVLMFEFGTFPKSAFDSPLPFVDRLDAFLAELPKGPRYGVEVRNPEYLGTPYFGTLASHNVAHVFNAWTRMPGLSDQIAREEAFTADFTVTRALLARGRRYEEAVETFAPYERIQDPNPSARQAMRELAERSRRMRKPAFLFVNNRLEGHAPSTIEGVIEGLV